MLYRKQGYILLALVLLSACGPVVAVQVQNAPVPTPAAPGGEGTTAGEGRAAGTSCQDTPGACASESVLTTVVTYLTFFAEMSGALVIAVAVARALLGYLPHIFGSDRNDTYKEDLRLQLGKSLALALEFEVAADILKTAVAPTLAVIAQLAGIIVLRTLLNYFLERELRQVEERHSGQRLAGRQPESLGQPASSARGEARE